MTFGDGMVRNNAARVSAVGESKSKTTTEHVAVSLGRRGFQRLLKPLGLCFVMAAALTIGTPPAQAGGGHILSTKSVSAPLGFDGICQRYAWACATRSSASREMGTDELMALAARVNGSVNARVRQVSDSRQYRRDEVWALPTAQGGDCEDFALLKKRELIRLGVPPDRLLIATALTRKRAAHAVLVLRTSSGDMVLDNRTSRIKPWQSTGLSFLRIQNYQAPHRWRMVLAGGMFG